MPHTYAGAAIDRAAQHRLDPEWLKERWERADSRFVCFAKDRPLVHVDPDGPSLDIRWMDNPDKTVPLEEAVFLGLDEQDCALFGMALPVDEEGEPKCGRAETTKLIDLRSLAAQGVLGHQDMGLLAQARSMLGWHASHRFCATCGNPSEIQEGGYKRKCPSCKREHFPRTDPVVIIVATDGDDCLLGRGAHFAEGSYSALAGFVEPGESIEEAARREVFEESGIRVGTVHYHSSQPWPFPSSLMIGLSGEAETRDLIIDYAELEDCRWFPREEAAAMMKGEHPDGLFCPPPFAIAHHLIKSFVAGN